MQANKKYERQSAGAKINQQGQCNRKGCKYEQKCVWCPYFCVRLKVVNLQKYVVFKKFLLEFPHLKPAKNFAFF